MSEEEKKKILETHELSVDELAAVSGGVVIDWPAECQATVENGSSCTGTDACYGVFVRYRRSKAKYGCSSTVSSRGLCSSSDYCVIAESLYEECQSDFYFYNKQDDGP